MGKIASAAIFDTTLWCTDEMFGPGIIQILLELDPAPSKEQLVNSLRYTLAMVPLLGCRIEKGIWRDRWIAIPDLDPEKLVDRPVPPDGRAH